MYIYIKRKKVFSDLCQFCFRHAWLNLAVMDHSRGSINVDRPWRINLFSHYLQRINFLSCFKHILLLK